MLTQWINDANAYAARVQEECARPAVREAVELLLNERALVGSSTELGRTPANAPHLADAGHSFFSRRTDEGGPQKQMFAAAEAWCKDHGGTQYPAYLARQHTSSKGYEYACTTWPHVFAHMAAPAGAGGATPHYFELINHTLPCKLYFDIDADSELVPMGNAAEVAAFYTRTRGFLTFVQCMLQLILPRLIPELAPGDPSRSPALSLTLKTIPLTANKVPSAGAADSSEGAVRGKLSVHYVVSLSVTTEDGERPLMFTNYASLHALMGLLFELAQWFSGTAEQRVAYAATHQALWLDPDGDRSELNAMFDTGVYTRNRLFRLWGSSKVAKAGAPRPLQRNRVLAQLLGPMQLDHMLLAEHTGTPATGGEHEGERGDESEGDQQVADQLRVGVPVSQDSCWTAWMFLSSLVTCYPPNVRVHQTLTLHYTPEGKRSRKRKREAGADVASALGGPDSPALRLDIPPPDPLVDRIIDFLECTIPGAESLSLVPTGGGPACLTFSSRGKYCTIRGGEHTSNHNFIVAWLDTCTCYQRCFNRQCAAQSMQAFASRNPGTNSSTSGKEERKRILTGRGPTHRLPTALYPEIAAYLKSVGLGFLSKATVSTLAKQEEGGSPAAPPHEPPTQRVASLLAASADISLQQYEQEMNQHLDEMFAEIGLDE